jgi:hypothetical protein
MHRFRTLARSSPLTRLLVVTLSLSLMTQARGAPLDDPDLSPQEREVLRRYARDTWHSFEAMSRTGGLPADGLHHDHDGTWSPTNKTTPTDIAAYLWSTLAAEKLGIIEPDQAHRRLDETLSAVARLERLHGFFYDKLDPRSGAPLTKKAKNGEPIRPVLSAVDNGWLAMALIMIRNTRPELRERAEVLVKPMDFHFFYDAYDPADPLKHPGQIRGSFEVDTRSFGYFHQLVNTEPRIASYIGIARGQIPPEHYYHMFRTLSPERRVQQQIPEGTWRTYRGVRVYEGHYTYQGMRIVPSWGGSMFEALMVPLFVPEDLWAPRSWGVNHPLYARAQIEHGLNVRHYGFWGFSSATIPEGGYQPYGVDALGTNIEGYHTYTRVTKSGGNAQPKESQPGGDPKPARGSQPRDGVVTPHASFLALPFVPREAMANLQKLEKRFPTIYTIYGFRDSVNISDGRTSDAILALDQGMIMAAIANALAERVMQHAFSDGAVEEALRPLMAPEEFTARPCDNTGAGPSG